MHHWKVSFTQLPSNPICKNHRVITSIMYRISQPTTASMTRAVTLSEHVSSFITTGNTRRLKNRDVMMILFPSRIVHSESDRDLKIEAESDKTSRLTKNGAKALPFILIKKEQTWDQEQDKIKRLHGKGKLNQAIISASALAPARVQFFPSLLIRWMRTVGIENLLLAVINMENKK